MGLLNGTQKLYTHTLDLVQRTEISAYFSLLLNADMLTHHTSDEIKSLIHGAKALLNVIGYDVVHITYETVEIVQRKDL